MIIDRIETLDRRRKKIFADYTAVCGKRVQISGLPDGKTLPTITGKFHHETDNES